MTFLYLVEQAIFDDRRERLDKLKPLIDNMNIHEDEKQLIKNMDVTQMHRYTKIQPIFNDEEDYYFDYSQEFIAQV